MKQFLVEEKTKSHRGRPITQATLGRIVMSIIDLRRRMHAKQTVILKFPDSSETPLNSQDAESDYSFDLKVCQPSL